MMNYAQHSELEQLFASLEDAPFPHGMGGLVTLINGQEEALPLQLLKVRAEIAGNCAKTTVEQHFHNPCASTIEVTHIFPLPIEGALISMELEAGEVRIRGLCKERQTAEQVFQDAKARGKRVALITQERDDVHTLKVSGISPGTDLVIRLTIIEFLDSIDGRFVWRFPTTIAPRFRPGNAIGHKGPGVVADSDRVPDASFLHAPARLEGGTALDLEVKVAAPVKEIESNFHTVNMSLETEGLKVTPTGHVTLNKDFVLAFSNGDESDLNLRAWTDGKYSLAILQAPLGLKSKGLARDAVYVIDISGSMQGPKLDAAKRALCQSLKGLRSGDRFLLIAFDTGTLRYKDDFQQANWLNVKKALWWINRLEVRGGTDMLPALQVALMGETAKDRLRTVLFITDGQASNEDELVATVAARRKRARLFTLGIDTAVNSSLLKKLSRVGGGTCELTGPQGNIEALILKIEKRFCNPVVDDIIVEGGELGAEDPKALFLGRPVTVLLKNSETQKTIHCRGQSAKGPVTMEVRPAKLPFSLGPLWAKRRIAYLQDRQTTHIYEKEELKPVITKIALEHSLLSKYTAFVAVDESSLILEQPHAVIQPVEKPDMWSSGAPGGFYQRPTMDRARLTADGACIGTPYFISPEQMQGSNVDERSDIFSLGLVFYQAFTGRRAFEGRNVLELFKKITKEKMKDPRKINPAIPKLVSKLILKMCWKKPKDRFQNCEEVLKDLHQFPLDWDKIPSTYIPATTKREPVDLRNQPAGKMIGVRVFDCIIEAFLDHTEDSWAFEATHRSGKKYVIGVFGKREGRNGERLRQRLQSAVALTSKLKEGHITRSLALAEGAKHLFVQRDHFVGESLGDRQRSWSMPPIEEILIYLHQALIGLSEAHRNRFLHRQISPDRLIISKSGFLKLTDFDF